MIHPDGCLLFMAFLIFFLQKKVPSSQIEPQSEAALTESQSAEDVSHVQIESQSVHQVELVA